MAKQFSAARKMLKGINRAAAARKMLRESNKYAEQLRKKI